MRKFKKVSIYILSITAILLVIGYFMKPMAVNFIEDKIKEEIGKIGQLTTDSINISILDRSLELINSSYESDEMGISFKLKKLKVDGFSLYQLLVRKHLKIDEVLISAPSFKQYARKEQPEDTNSQKQEKKLKLLSIKKIEVLNGNAQFFSTDSSIIHQINQISSQFEGISIDLREKITVSQIEYTSFNISIDSTFLFQNSKHFLTSNKVAINNTDGIAINDLEYYPNKLYKSGSKKVDYRVNWTNTKIDSLHLKLDWNLLQNKNQIHATSVNINELNYSSIIDKNYPRKDIKEKPLPHQMIQQIKIPFTVDTLELVNSRFQYNEIKKDRNEKGEIYFTAFNATIENITNDSASLANNHTMNAIVKTKLMDQSVMTVNIDYDLSSADGHHRISGNLADFDLTELNQIFMPLALIRFETGYLNKIDFNYYLNSTVSEGSMDFYYEDLKAIVYNDGEDYKTELIGKVFSGLANGLIIRKSNPLRGNFIKGEVAFEREKDKSFLTFWWKSLFSGMKSTVMRNEQI